MGCEDYRTLDEIAFKSTGSITPGAAGAQSSLVGFEEAGKPYCSPQPVGTSTPVGALG